MSYLSKLPFGIRWYIILILSLLLSFFWLGTYRSYGGDVPEQEGLIDLAYLSIGMILYYILGRRVKATLNYPLTVLYWIGLMIMTIHVIVQLWAFRVHFPLEGPSVVLNFILPLSLAFLPAVYLYMREYVREIPWVERSLFGRGGSAMWGTIRTFSRMKIRIKGLGVFRNRTEGVRTDDIFVGTSTSSHDPFPRFIGLPPQEHLIITGQNGAGKWLTSGALITATNSASMVITDPKAEIAKATFYRRCSKEYLQYLGVKDCGDTIVHLPNAQAHVLDPFDIFDGPRAYYIFFNDMSLDDPDCRILITTFANACIIKNSNKGSDYFDGKAEQLLAALLVLYMYLIPNESQSLGGFFDMVYCIDEKGRADLTQFDDLIIQMLACPAAGGLAAQAGMEISQMGDREKGAVLSTLGTNLKWMSDPAIRAHTSKVSNFSFKTFGNKVVDTPSGPQDMTETLYITCPDYLMSGAMIRWIRCLLALGSVCMQRRDPLPERPTMMLLDEFGKLQSDIKTISEGFQIFRHYKIQITAYLQGLGQLKRFSPDLWETILGQVNSIYFGIAPTDKVTPEFISKVLGKHYQYTKDAGGTIGGLFRPKIKSKDNVDLLTPDEVAKLLRKSSDRQIVIPVDGLPVISRRLAFKPVRLNHVRFKTIGAGGLKGHFFDFQSGKNTLMELFIKSIQKLKSFTSWSLFKES